MITIATNLLERQPTLFKSSHDSYIMQQFPSSTISMNTINNQYYFDDPFCQSLPTENWSERVLQDITGLLHVLSPAGKILYCSESCIELTGYHPHELVGRSLTDFLHADDLDSFLQNFHLAFNCMTRIKVHYRIRRKNNSYLLLESIGQPKRDAPNQPPQSFFAIAQPYLSRNNGLLDSFLELKMENDRLKKQLNGLVQQQQQQQPQHQQQQYYSPPLDQQQFLLRQHQQQHYYSLSMSPSLDHNLLIPTTDQRSSPQSSPQKPASNTLALFPRENATETINSLNQWNRYSTPSVASTELNEAVINDIITSPPIIACSTDTRKEKWKRRVSLFNDFHVERVYSLFCFFDNRRNIEASMTLCVLIVEQHLLLNGEKDHMGPKRKLFLYTYKGKRIHSLL
jgi:PAS domain S-box-containing protein